MKKEKRLGLFLGKANLPSIGRWISLPMDDMELENTLKSIASEYGEYIISDRDIIDESLSYLSYSEYQDVKELNYVLNKPLEYLALYIEGGDDIEYANEFYNTREDYIFIPGVSNTEELGEALVRRGFIGYVPKHLIDSGYIDFEQIGLDFECNGITIYSKMKVAIGQISEDNYKKWKALLKRPTLLEYLLQNHLSLKEVDKHESDLYVKVSELSDTLIDNYMKFYGPEVRKEKFICQRTNTEWYDLPFMYISEFIREK